MNKISAVFLGVGLVFFAVLFVPKIWLPGIALWGQGDKLLVKSATGQVFSFGSNPQKQAEKLSPLSPFSTASVLDIFSVPLGKTQKTAGISLTRLSENTVQVRFGEMRLLFFQRDFTSSELATVLLQPLDLTADFWITKKPLYLSSLPLPTAGILFISQRSPSAKFKRFTHDQHLPLISTKETTGFLLTRDGAEWELRVNK